MNQREHTDAALLLRCQLGDGTAWDLLVQRWHPRLWAFISRMLTDRAVAEDVVQVVWLKVVRSLGQLDDTERWQPWLFRIARLSIADQLRKQYRSPPRERLNDVAGEDQAAATFETRDSIEHGLRYLHPTEREAVILHYMEQLCLADVAHICDVPVGTVKSRLHRARKILTNVLDDGKH